jgi:hypothetical protein
VPDTEPSEAKAPDNKAREIAEKPEQIEDANAQSRWLCGAIGTDRSLAPQRCDLGKWQRHRAGLLRRAAQHYEKRPHARAERAFAQVHPIIQRTFDISAMVRLSVGPFWTTLSQTERQ